MARGLRPRSHLSESVGMEKRPEACGGRRKCDGSVLYPNLNPPLEVLSMKRSSGILLHITSLPSPYGIGNLGQAARDFVDFLSAAKQHYWQILPISPTG